MRFIKGLKADTRQLQGYKKKGEGTMKDLQKFIKENKGGYNLTEAYTVTEIKGEHELTLIALRNAMFRYGLRRTELEPYTVCNDADIRRAYDVTFQFHDVLYNEYYVLKYIWRRHTVKVECYPSGRMYVYLDGKMLTSSRA